MTLLMSPQQIGVRGAVAPVAVSFTASAVDAAAATIYNAAAFQGLSFGAAAGDRKMVCIVNGIGTTNAARSVSSMTIGGVAASLVVAQKGTTAGTDDHYVVEMWQADVPTGATGDVSVTWNAAMDNCGIGLFRVVGAGTGPSAAHATGSDYVQAATQRTATIDVPANGIAIGGAAQNDRTAAWATWDTGVDEDFDAFVESAQEGHTGASRAYATESLAQNIQVTADSGQRFRLVAASWGPA